MASRNITDCIQELQNAWPKLKAEFEHMFPGWKMILTATYRTPEEQFKIFQDGRTFNHDLGQWIVHDQAQVKTMRDGIKRLSLHNDFPAKAFDVALINPAGAAVWTSPVKPFPEQWAALPGLAPLFGLENGGSWSRLHDWPHFQLRIKP